MRTSRKKDTHFGAIYQHIHITLDLFRLHYQIYRKCVSCGEEIAVIIIVLKKIKEFNNRDLDVELPVSFVAAK